MRSPRPPEPADRAEAGPADPGPAGPAPAGPGPAGPAPAGRRRELVGDLRVGAVLAVATVVAGALAGVGWALLAPRADYRVVQGGAVPVGLPSPELPAADDGVYVLVLGAVGLLAGGTAWLLRRHRGVVVLLAAALGSLAASLLAWWLGQLLAPAPTAAALAQVGATVTTGVRLRSHAAVAVAPLLASAVYVVAALFCPADDLGRTGPEPPLPPAEHPREAAVDVGTA